MPGRNYSIDLLEIRAFDPEPSHFYWHVLDRISFMAFPTHDSQLKKALKAAPEGVRLFWLSTTIEGYVENGGLGSYFGHRRPVWLYGMAKKAILKFDCPKVVKIIEEAERYVYRNRHKLYDGMAPKDWAEIMGPVAMEKATKRIRLRILRACNKLHRARANYLKRFPERFGAQSRRRPGGASVPASRTRRQK